MKILAFLVFFTAALFADSLINPNELPQKIKDFVAKNYPQNEIKKAKIDDDSYELKLCNYTELEFDLNSNLKEIKSPISEITLFSELTSKARALQKNAKLIKIEKKIIGYKLKFDNDYEVYIDENGEILRTKQD